MVGSRRIFGQSDVALAEFELVEFQLRVVGFQLVVIEFQLIEVFVNGENGSISDLPKNIIFIGRI